MTLYELENNYKTFLDLCEDGEISEEAMLDMQEYLLTDIDEKLEGYGCVLRQLQADVEAVKAEKLRLAGKQAQLENNIDRIRETMKSAMHLTDRQKVKTKLFTFSISTRLKTIVDAPEADLPEQFRKVTYKADTKAISEYLLAGHEVPWAHQEQAKSLTVR